MKSFPKVRDLAFRVLCGWRGVKRRIANFEFRVDESLRRWSFEKESLSLDRIHSIIRPGDIVFDVGANFGLYCLPISRWVADCGRLYAFEPLPGNIALLSRNLFLNQISNVIIVDSAVSNGRLDTVRFFSDNENVSLTASLNVPSSASSIEVKNLRLDDWCERTGTFPDFIKIDVEGAEMEVLRGADQVLRTHKPKLFIEVHGFALPSFGSNIEELRSWLCERGYVEELIEGGDDYFSAMFEIRHD